MSTILKALKRLQEDGAAPPADPSLREELSSLASDDERPGPTRRPAAPSRLLPWLLLGGGAGAAALVLGVLLWLRAAPEAPQVAAATPPPRPTPETAMRSPTGSAPGRPAPARPAPVATPEPARPAPVATPEPARPAPPAATEPQPEVRSAATAPPPAASERVVTRDSRAGDAQPPAREPTELASATPAPDPEPLEPKPAPRAAPKPAPTEPAPRAEPKPAPTEPAPRAAPKPAPPKPAPRAAPKPAPVATVRMPAVVVERTIWHPDSARRRVTLSVPEKDEPVELREGDAIGTLVVETIEPSGVVFLHAGREVRRKVGATR